jgi:hypothetical protein
LSTSQTISSVPSGQHVRRGRAFIDGSLVENGADSELPERLQVVAVEVAQVRGAKQQPGAHSPTVGGRYGPDAPVELILENMKREPQAGRRRWPRRRRGVSTR